MTVFYDATDYDELTKEFTEQLINRISNLIFKENKIMEKRIKIVEVKEITTKDGKKFTAFKALDKNGKKMDCKFTRAVVNVPDRRCFIYVDEDAFNVDESKEFPVLWVKRVNKIEAIETENAANKYFD